MSVADNGIGIDARYHKQIFKPFFRVPADNSHYIKGFGVGLHYVRNIVKAHNWRIALERIQGKGSRFTLQIPA